MLLWNRRKKRAQPYLEKSAARKVIDAYRYLGKLYYDIYRFDDAVDNYEQHIEWLGKEKRPNRNGWSRAGTNKASSPYDKRKWKTLL